MYTHTRMHRLREHTPYSCTHTASTCMHRLARMTVSIRLICVVKMKQAYVLFMHTASGMYIHRLAKMKRACTLFMQTLRHVHALSRSNASKHTLYSCTHKYVHTCINLQQSMRLVHAHAHTWIHALPRRSDSVSISLVHAHTYAHTCMVSQP